VVVVREQDRVDWTELGGGDRRTGELARSRPPAEAVAPAGGIEGRVGEEPPAAHLEQHRWAADVGDADIAHTVAGTVACSMAHDSA
jgi:hypothetical protein